MGERRVTFVLGVMMIMTILVQVSHELQSSETQTLLRIKKLLEHPRAMENITETVDICWMHSTQFLRVVCQNNSLIELHIVGDKIKGNSSNATLSSAFLADSFFTTLARLYSLKALSLVSLGIWGPLSSKLDRLCFLENLNISKNSINGSIPYQLSRLRKLQSFVMEDNLLNGSVPDWFSTMPNLHVLNLKNNRLKGHLPPTLGSLQALRVLCLSNNQITGNLPELSSLSNLTVLEIQQNRLGPDFPLLGTGLERIDISHNKFKADIPRYLVALTKLWYLDVSHNALTGTPPSFLFSKLHIKYLNLAKNSLTGSLPRNLSCSRELAFLDISENLLGGELPACLMRSKAHSRTIRFHGNCLIKPMQYQSPFCQTKSSIQVTKSNRTGRKKCVLIGIGIGVVGGILLLMVLGAFLLIRRCALRRASKKNQPRKILTDSHSTGVTTELLVNARYISKAIMLGTQGLPQYRSYALEEVNEATNNFSESSFMGEGFYGKLYKGKMADGTLVAIRCLRTDFLPRVQNLKLHFEMFSKLRHLNLVTLLGHCIVLEANGSTVKRMFLVFEYVPNGTLQSHLSGLEVGECLNWQQRLKVVSDLAKAIHFLHTGIVPGISENNLKISNVLLDQGHIAKLSDYGLPGLTVSVNEAFTENSFYSQKEHTIAARKTNNDKADIYNFGLILLEVIAGKLPTLQGEDDALSMVNLIMKKSTRMTMVDSVIRSTCVDESLTIIIDLTSRCLSHDPNLRPSLEDALWNLQYASQLQEKCNNDLHEQENSNSGKNKL